MGEYKFYLQDSIGQGAFSKVYRGVDSFNQEKLVAVKELNVRE